jgi:hypothetical protein
MKNEILYSVEDTSKIKYGKDLHIPLLDPRDGSDWSIEAILVAEDMANVDFPDIPDNIPEWSYSYYCKVNGVKYKVTHFSTGEYYPCCDIKIELA